MKVSIALATCNGERWLQQQLDSLAAQTLPPFELVLSDDHSSDRTLSIVEKFATKVSFPVHIVRHTAHLGFADNFVSALRHCSGQAIALCDQDDVWHASKLERCVQAMCSHRGITLVHHDCEEVDSTLESLGIILRPVAAAPPRHERGNICSVVGISMLGCCMLARRSVVTLLLDCWPESHLQYVRRSGSRGVLGHDLAMLHMASVVGHVCYLPEVLLQHRRHEKNTWSPDLLLAKGSRITPAGKSEVLRECADVRARGAQMYKEMAERAQAKNHKSAADYLKRLSDRDRRLAAFFDHRAELYQAQLQRERFSIYWKGFRNGDYRGAGGLFGGMRSAFKDFAFVIAGSVAPRSLEALSDRLHLTFHPREIMK